MRLLLLSNDKFLFSHQNLHERIIEQTTKESAISIQLFSEEEEHRTLNYFKVANLQYYEANLEITLLEGLLNEGNRLTETKVLLLWPNIGFHCETIQTPLCTIK